MTDIRQSLARAFVDDHGFQNRSMTLIAGDASNRKYYRLDGPQGSILLMDAPPEKGEDVRPFVKIALYLESIGLSAPTIFEADEADGFLLIEDFGDAIFARLIEGNPQLETQLYETATDVLVHLHQNPAPELPAYDAATMADLAGLSVDWYANSVADNSHSTVADEFRNVLARLFEPLDSTPKVLIQRDYHAENLIWLPDREGVGRVGLLDFQDAMLGHPAYDLVSILQDARRDVPSELADQMVQRYVDTTQSPVLEFRFAYHLLGLQRNLRILGVFARLCIRDGKPHYINLIPRVWDHIQTNLQVLDQDDLIKLLSDALPKPSNTALEKLRHKCPTPPAQ